MVPPAQIARLVEEVGVRKVALGVVETLTLAVLAGAFIAFEAMLYTVAITGSELGYGPILLIGAAAFSLGLILVVIGGAELFTGNSLIVIAWADGRVGKAELPAHEALIRGVLSNVLVCLAVWMCFAARSFSGRALAIVFPITGFVALGFEHSVANMYLISVGMLAAGEGPGLGALAVNLVPVTIGNVIGGGVLVALVYRLVYLRPART